MVVDIDPTRTAPAGNRATRRRMALWALALGAFAIGCTEFVIVGLLPQISTDLAVSEGAVGQLVTMNAVAVAVSAPTLGAVMARFSCRPVLLVTLAVYAAAHVVAALAPTFAVLLASRVVTGATFGLYLAVAFAAAARLVSDERRAGALATVQGGITTATALGVPLGMVLSRSAGAATGWRLPFVAIAVLAALAVVAVALTAPRLAPQGGVSFRRRIAVLRRRPVALATVAVAVFWGGSLCAFTYIVPLLAGPAGLGGGAVIGVLLLAGAMSVVGNVAGGRSADRALSSTLLGTATLTLVGLVALFVFASVTVVAIAMVAVWQLAAWSYVPAVAAAVFRLGGDEGEAAVSFSVAAFNVGIVAGAGLGGLALQGVGLPGVGVVAGVLAALALALTVVVVRLPAMRDGLTST